MLSRSFFYWGIAILFISLLPNPTLAQPQEQPTLQVDPVYWHNGHQKHPLWKSTNEVVILHGFLPSQRSKQVGKQAQVNQDQSTTVATIIPGAKIIESHETWTRVQ